jgi:hypothetical protein
MGASRDDFISVGKNHVTFNLLRDKRQNALLLLLLLTMLS